MLITSLFVYLFVYKNCVFCQNEFSEYSIKNYENWDLQLFRDDQYYIGRCAIVFQNRHIEDITELNNEERDELFDTVIPELQESLGKMFDPDLYNYTSLGNDCRHLHIHIIPRYKNTVMFDGEEFEDEFWNETYAQDYQSIKLDDNKYTKLINQINKNLK